MPTSKDATPIVIDDEIYIVDGTPVRYVISPDPNENLQFPDPLRRIAVASDGRILRERGRRGLVVRKWSLGSPNNKGAPQIAIGKNSAVHRHNRMILVCRLVATAWVGPCPGPEYDVDHADDNRSNNHPSNLSWKTHKHNMQRMFIRLNGRLLTAEEIRERGLQASSDYYNNNKNKRNKQTSEWKRKNRDKVNSYQRARRARQKAQLSAS